jgi:DNA polymerase elongation subunit (family B)
MGANGVFASATGRTCAVEQDCDPMRMQRPAALPDDDGVEARPHKRRRGDAGDADDAQLVPTTHIGSLMRRPDGRHEMRFAQDSGLREVHIAYETRVATEPSRAVVVHGDIERVAGDDPIIQICGTVRVGGKTVLRHALVLGGCTPFTFADKDGVQARLEIEACQSEEQLLLRWQEVVRRVDPDLIYGFNTSGFDIEYIWKRAERLGLFERDRHGGTFGWLARSLGPAKAGEKSFTSGFVSRASLSPARAGCCAHSARLTHLKMNSATGSNEMYHLDAPGRVAVDVLWVRRSPSL